LERAGDIAAAAGSLRPSDPLLRRGLHVGIGLIIVLGVVLALTASLGRLPEIEWSFRPGWLALGTLAFAVTLAINAEIWRRILLALGPRIDPLPAQAIWLTSGLGRYVPTSLLMPMVRVAMCEREGVAKRICLASVVYEMALALMGAIVLGAYFVIDLPALQGHWERFLVLAVPIAGVIALHPRVFHYAADVLLTRLGRATLPASLSLPQIAAFTALYVLSFVVAGIGVYGFAHTSYPVDSGDLVVITGAFAVATALGLIAFVLPAGIIAREAGLAVALAPVMPAGPALAVAVIARIVQIALELGMALAGQAALRLRRAD